MNNRFVHNDAWGVIVVPYSDSGPPCTGGTMNSLFLGTNSCLYDDYGDALIGNKFSRNGSYRNPTNGDFDQLNFEQHPTDCYSANANPAGLTKVSATLEQTYPTCSGNVVQPNLNIPFLNEVLCDSGVTVTGFGCQKGDFYPPLGKPVMHPLPKGLRSMPNPCLGVPANPWCTKNGHH